MPQRIIIILPPGTTTWRVPGGVNKLKLEGWGPGGAGTISGATYGNGGGGGAYSSSDNFSVNPGQILYLNIPNATSAGGALANTWVNKNSNSVPTTTSDGILSLGGSNGTDALSGIGIGGSATNSIGNTKYSGGNGSARGSGNSAGGGGGGGASSTNNGSVGTGGSGTTGGDGGDSPSAGTGGTGSNNTANPGTNGNSNSEGGGGGGGGAGGTTVSSAGGNGGTPGGGGGGGGYNILTKAANPGTGGAGQVRITYIKKSVLII